MHVAGWRMPIEEHRSRSGHKYTIILANIASSMSCFGDRVYMEYIFDRDDAKLYYKVMLKRRSHKHT